MYVRSNKIQMLQSHLYVLDFSVLSFYRIIYIGVCAIFTYRLKWGNYIRFSKLWESFGYISLVPEYFFKIVLRVDRACVPLHVYAKICAIIMDTQVSSIRAVVTPTNILQLLQMRQLHITVQSVGKLHNFMYFPLSY